MTLPAGADPDTLVVTERPEGPANMGNQIGIITGAGRSRRA